MFVRAIYLTSITAFVTTFMVLSPLPNPKAHAAEKGKNPTLNAFDKKRENGVTVWRANMRAPAPIVKAPSTTQKAAPATTIKPGTKIRFKRSDIRRRPSTRSRIRVIGHFSGFGERAQVIQGFYSGYKNNAKRRFPQQRPDGRRRVTRRFY